MISTTTPTLFQKFARIASCLTVLMACSVAYAADPPAQPNPEEQKTLYAVGLSVARSLSVFTLSPAELAIVQQGITDALSGKKSDIDLPSYNMKIQELAKARRKSLGEKQAKAGKEFLEKAAKAKGAVKTPSGMVYQSLVDGKGNPPTANDIVTVNYRGTLIDGKEFDSSFKRGKPLEFKLSNVISCWVEGLQMMKTGGKAKLVCPPNLAYGENGAGDLILPDSTLNFEIELISARADEPPKPAASAPVTPSVPAKK